MNLIAKNILPEKFWIIEDESQSRRGTIQLNQQSVKIVLDGSNHEFETFDHACDQLGIVKSVKPVRSVKAKEEYFVHGYPTNTKPFNELYDAKHRLPMYTKNEKSRSYFAAGYYIIHFDFGWAQAFCPKVITLNRNEYAGPYKTELEMKEQLRIHNGRS